MAGLNYLWRNRARFPITSTEFYRAWAKRILLLRALFKRNSVRRRLVHSGATISELAEIGNVEAIGDKSKLKIGEFSYIGKVELALYDFISIGNNVCINDGSHLLTASHDVLDPLWQHIKAPIVIEDYAWISTGAIILPGVKIGRGAVVGAGAVVAKSVEPYCIVVGNPAKVLQKKRTEMLKYNPCGFLAANNAWLHG